MLRHMSLHMIQNNHMNTVYHIHRNNFHCIQLENLPYL